MPWEKCVKYKGKTYCWNPETRTIEEIIVRTLKTSECPEEVIYRLLNTHTEKDTENQKKEV